MSRPLTFLYHPQTLDHHTGASHPERPDRLRHLLRYLEGTALWPLMEHARPEQCPRERLLRVHPETYVAWVEKSIADGVGLLDGGDTHVSAGSWDAALLAAGGACAAVDAACGDVKRHAFSAARPPGHHAETRRAMGFCLFNNVAIAARYAQDQYGVERVAVVDWDVHHGNGTQEIFWRDSSVLYISTHQFPLWPGSGARDERGEADGEGFTLNCPMPPGSGEENYVSVFRETIVPRLRDFRPQLLMISAGFDAHADDPLATIMLRDASFGTLTEMLGEITTEAGVVSVLEGGYDLDALARSVASHLSVLAGA